jgi:hypothetical protein
MAGENNTMQSSQQFRVWLCALAAIAASLAAAAAQTPDQFDKPAEVRTIKPKPDQDTQIRCTVFADLMIRETQDGPESENAAMVKNPKAPCTAKAAQGEILLDTAGMTLDGRRGAFLLFSDLDPHGATNFAIIDARSGRILFRDAALSNPVLQSLTLESDTLRLRYRRGVNAPCSLMRDMQACWAELVKDGLVPDEVTMPAANICAESYQRDRSPRENPSIVVYATEVAIDAGGNAKVLSRGTVDCEPMP